MIYHTLGIILRRTPFREDDRLINFYTLTHGKIQAVARGSRKIKSKLAAHLEPFLVSKLTIAQGRNFDQVAGASISENFSYLKTDLARVALGSTALELVDQLTKPGHQDQRIFNLLRELFEVLNKKLPTTNFQLLTTIVKVFALKLLALLGYAPELYHCLLCQKKAVPGGNFFHFLKGGLICNTCRATLFLEDEYTFSISTNAIKVLRLVLKSDLKKFLNIKMSQSGLDELDKIIYTFLKFHLERELKSEEFFHSLIKLKI